MKEVIIATNNAGKGKDFEALFTPLGIKVLTLNDIEEKIEVEETGKTFEENAILKAETVAKLLGKTVIADDSGLEIDALGGAPGVYSARYGGPDSTDDKNIDKALHELAEVKESESYCKIPLRTCNRRTRYRNGNIFRKLRRLYIN